MSDHSDNNTDPGRLLKTAEALFRSGQLIAAQEVFRTLLDDATTGADAHAGLGMVYLQNNELDEAERLFRVCMNKWGGTADAFYGVGVVHAAIDPGYARAHFEFALLKNPNHSGAQTRLARMSQKPNLHTAPLASPKQAVSAMEIEADHKQSSVSSGMLQPDAAISGNSTELESPSDLKQLSRSDRKRLQLSGTISELSQHMEMRGRFYKRQYQVWNFVLVRRADLPPLSVQMEGTKSVGHIRNGDEVELPKLPKEGRVAKPAKLMNHSRNAAVKLT